MPEETRNCGCNNGILGGLFGGCCENSEILFFIKIFKVKFVFTFLSLQYFIASFNIWLSKFVAEFLALNMLPPK